MSDDSCSLDSDYNPVTCDPDMLHLIPREVMGAEETDTNMLDLDTERNTGETITTLTC